MLPHEAIAFADSSMELISYYAIDASSELAKERGNYSSYEGSLWSRESFQLIQLTYYNKRAIPF